MTVLDLINNTPSKTQLQKSHSTNSGANSNSSTTTSTNSIPQSTKPERRNKSNKLAQVDAHSTTYLASTPPQSPLHQHQSSLLIGKPADSMILDKLASSSQSKLDRDLLQTHEDYQQEKIACQHQALTLNVIFKKIIK